LAYPFGPALTLRQFIEKAKHHGATLRRNPAITESPTGPIRFAYLWIDKSRFVPLPDIIEGFEGFGDEPQ